MGDVSDALLLPCDEHVVGIRAGGEGGGEGARGRVDGD